jgi:hypothetical protein
LNEYLLIVKEVLKLFTIILKKASNAGKKYKQYKIRQAALGRLHSTAAH